MQSSNCTAEYVVESDMQWVFDPRKGIRWVTVVVVIGGEQPCHDGNNERILESSWCHQLVQHTNVLHHKTGKLLPPEQAAELLPWYMQWSRDLAAEMHQRRL